MNKYAKIQQNNPNSSNVMSKAKWICNFFNAWHMSRSPQLGFLLKLTNEYVICHPCPPGTNIEQFSAFPSVKQKFLMDAKAARA